MPAKDKYHDAVVNALKKDSWKILEDPYTLYVKGRHLYADLLVEKSGTQITVEIKVFENVPSPIEYFASILGKYILYQIALKLNNIQTALFIAVPKDAHNGFLTEPIAQIALKQIGAKLIVYEPISEVILQWIR